MTTGRIDFLVDTNVLVYAYDSASPLKRRRAIDVLNRLRGSDRGCLSVQVMSEFYTNVTRVTRKPLFPLTPDQAQDSSIRYVRSWYILDLTDRTFLDAVQAVQQHRMSYWDALIWATASQNGVANILTEDQQDGRLIGPIRYHDPFSADFDLSRLA
jgi:predicted nucleic acid-binding protein